MYNILFFIIIIVIGFYISKNNYKTRASTINKNLLEFGHEIIRIYYSLNESQHSIFKECLTSKETIVLNNLLNNSYENNANINNLQGSMLVMEEIMKKLKSITN
ncbi:hypothetical protein [Clostridium sp.]|uniref:hypothetical protein n=1 Tax=Clostridium sp. TaxID=1506 RepID=UPI002FC7E93A